MAQQPAKDDLAIAQQFYTFANNTGLRPLMLNDATTTQSLVALLGSTTPAAVKKALEAIFILASDPQTAPQTSKLPGLLGHLADLYDYDVECPENTSIRRLAQQNMNCLSKAPRRDSQHGNSLAVGDRVEVRSQQNRAGAFGAKYHHQVAFVLEGVNTEDDKAAVEACVIRIKGSLAVTVDLTKQQLSCFTSSEPELYTHTVQDEMAKLGYGVTVMDTKNRQPGGQQADAQLVSFNNKKGHPKKGQQEAGWLGNITSYFW